MRATGSARITAAIAKSSMREAFLAAVEPPREHQRHGDLHDLGGLDGGEAEVEPAPRAVEDLAEERDAEQQREARDVDRQRQAHQQCGGTCAKSHSARTPPPGCATCPIDAVEGARRRRPSRPPSRPRASVSASAAISGPSMRRERNSKARLITGLLVVPELRRAPPGACRGGSSRRPGARSARRCERRGRRSRPGSPCAIFGLSAGA